MMEVVTGMAAAFSAPVLTAAGGEQGRYLSVKINQHCPHQRYPHRCRWWSMCEAVALGKLGKSQQGG